MRNSLIILLITLISFSCKRDKKITNTQEESEFVDLDNEKQIEFETENTDESFKIILEAIVTKDDKFNLMYLTDKITSWSPKGLIKKNILGQDDAQKIEFIFPKGVFPTKFRIDTGTNKNQTMIDFYKITFRFKENELVIKENMIDKYLIPNKYASFAKDASADLSLFEVDNKYNPLIIATDYFMGRLDLNLNK